jgi:[ribosomal protein S5]-alanine N-acetyltransferase
MQLTTDRLILREFVEADWPAVLAYQRDPRYLRYTHWIDRSPQDVKQFVQMFLSQQFAQPRTKYQFAVVLKDTQRLIGNCGIRLAVSRLPRSLAARTSEAIDAHEADIGYELAPAHWGHGYATEAARAIVAFGFTELRLHRISAWCVADNTASAHVLEKVGMWLEGRLRENEYFKDRWWDTLLYAILKTEWTEDRS